MIAFGLERIRGGQFDVVKDSGALPRSEGTKRGIHTSLRATLNRIRVAEAACGEYNSWRYQCGEWNS